MPLLAACLVALLCIAMPRAGDAQGLVQTGRYTAVAPVPSEAQQAPLQAIVSVDFPDSVTTVGGAVQHVLADTGYALNDVIHWDAEVFDLFDRPLPEVQRTLGPLTVLVALKTLAGPTFRLVIDPVHRLVGFELDPVVSALGFGATAPDEET